MRNDTGAPVDQLWYYSNYSTGTINQTGLWRVQSPLRLEPAEAATLVFEFEPEPYNTTCEILHGWHKPVGPSCALSRAALADPAPPLDGLTDGDEVAILVVNGDDGDE